MIIGYRIAVNFDKLELEYFKVLVYFKSLSKNDENSFENEGVFNPGIYQDGNTVHMFYRAVSEGNFSCIGYCRLNGPLTAMSLS